MAHLPRDSDPLGPEADPLSEQMLAWLREARRQTGISLRALSEALDGEFSASYLSLMLQGKRRPTPNAIESMARVLGVDAEKLDALRQWSRLMDRRRSSPSQLLDAARQLEADHPDLLVRVPAVEQVRISDSARSDAEASQSVSAPRGRIPVVTEGCIPDAGAPDDAVKHVELDPSLLEAGDTLREPFAWRVGPESVRRVSDLLCEGDLVVLSRMGPPLEFRPHDLWLVEIDGKPVITRAVRDGELLVLPGSPGSDARPTILRSGPEGSAEDRVKAKVVAAIRTWSPSG